MTSLCLVLLAVGFVSADIYFHTPRGSNNRLDEDDRERDNANRLFDSQNNNRGGYNVGSTDDEKMYYYGGSNLQLEWTNQHSCGGKKPKAICQIVLQYMCSDDLRDGESTSTISPDRPDRESRGMHEDVKHYLACRYRSRNYGLFKADQNLQSEGSHATRQNPNRNRHGFECAEERDYYPYWAPSPWIDIAVFTNERSKCKMYRSESQNVKAKYACVLKERYEGDERRFGIGSGDFPLNQEDCENMERRGERIAEWKEFAAHGVAAPQCLLDQFSRDNHLGNVRHGQHMSYNWTVPNIDRQNCALRVRYNISTAEFDPWNTDSETDVDAILAQRYGLSEAEAKERNYEFEGDPEVYVFGRGGGGFDLELAINTAQYGRTFQDRSHAFSLRTRPSQIPSGTRIHNLNVRGKRGNIVQTYPAVEYDFVPNTLQVAQGDIVHIQWNGADTNPKNNDGEGKAGTDRSNIVLLDRQQYAEGSGGQWGPGGKYGHFGVNYPMHLRNVTFLGFDRGDLEELALLKTGSSRSKRGGTLDDEEPYFDMKPMRVDSPAGIYKYMSTRNNNFSNRDQKGQIVVYTQDQFQRLLRQRSSDLDVQRRDFDETLDEVAHDEVEMDVKERSLKTLLEGLAEELNSVN